MKKLFLTLFFLCAMTAMADGAVLQTIVIDFAGDGWAHLLNSLWGAYPEAVSFRGKDCLEFGGGSFYGTPVIAIPRGAVVGVEFDACTTQITANGEEWRTAAVQLAFLDNGREIGHTDLFNTGKETPWKRHASSIPLKCNGIALNFGNYGKDGKFRIANIRITVEIEGTNVERDPSFAGMFGINDWFVQKGGSDWDGLDLGSAENVSVENDLFPGEGATVKIDGPGTVVSQIFPYHGEGVVVGGWFRQQDIARGDAPWATAGIQLVYLDENDQHVGHADLTPEFTGGDRPWTYYLMEFAPGSITPRAKSIAVYLRVFGGAAGAACFDNISVVLHGEGESRHYDASRGKISVGAEELGDLRPVWNGVDLSYCSQVSLPQVHEALRRLRAEAGVEYVRCREFFNGPFPIKALRGNQLPECDFGQLDGFMDVLVNELGFNIVATIETVPPQLHTEKRGHIPSDFSQWGLCVEALVEHWLDRYGEERVCKWIFECWNEPGSGFFVGTDSQFTRLFLTYLKTLKRIESRRGVRLRIGTPSGAADGLLSVIMAEAKNENADYVTDISTHIYGGYDGSLGLFKQGVDGVRRRLADNACGSQAPIHVTEYNGSAMVSRHFDTQTGAAYLVKANRLWLDLGIQRAYYYSVIDHPYLNLQNHFSGDLGVFTHHGPIAKPSFNAWTLLNRMKGRRLKLSTSSDPFDAIACLGDDGAVQVLVTTFSEEEPESRQTVPVIIDIDWEGRPSQLERATFIQIDSSAGNAHSAFLAAGSPSASEMKDATALQQASALTEKNLTGYGFQDGRLVIPVPMELNSVLWLRIEPQRR